MTAHVHCIGTATSRRLSTAVLQLINYGLQYRHHFPDVSTGKSVAQSTLHWRRQYNFLAQNSILADHYDNNRSRPANNRLLMIQQLLASGRSLNRDDETTTPVRDVIGIIYACALAEDRKLAPRRVAARNLVTARNPRTSLF